MILLKYPTDELFAIRAKAGVEFAFPHMYAALQIAQKILMEDLFEWVKEVETANFSARWNNNSGEKHSYSKVGNYKEKDWTNKQLAAKCPQNLNQKCSKFEKSPKKDKKREIITQEEERNTNFMSDDSSMSSNNSNDRLKESD